jgi:hypothetical protein
MHPFRCDDVNHRPPPRQRVTIDRRQEALRKHFEQVVRAHVRSIEGFAHAVEVGCAGTGDDEVLGEDGRADEVHACGEGGNGWEWVGMGERGGMGGMGGEGVL